MTDTSTATRYDVAICGGGLAGLTLALQLRQQHPDLRVLVVEKTTRPLPTAAHKVGESSVELGSQYLERLGLGDYIQKNHIIKFGLRFFPGGGTLPLAQRTEIGPAHEPIVRSYQLDRGTFETDLRQMVIDAGATLLEGHVVGDVEIGPKDTPHTFIATPVDNTESPKTIACRWLVDATGRSALLRRQMKMTRRTRHAASSGWFRIKGRLDISDVGEGGDWGERPGHQARWRSTNHLMGTGYWAWVIPLSSGNTSIGLVVHEETHDPKAVLGLDGVKAFLHKHEPALAEAVDSHEVMDFLAIRGYSHNTARSWSTDRWALVGEAGAFPDPLYSPGTDFIAFANSFTEELIAVDQRGDDLETRTRELNLQYRALVNGTIDVYQQSGPTFGHARAMHAKLFWDNFSYWSFPCQYFQQDLFRTTGELHTAITMEGARFVELSSYVQSLTRAWAEIAPAEPEAGFAHMPCFPSVLIDAHIALQDKMSPEETLAYLRRRKDEAEQIVGELLVRAMFEVGEQHAKAIFERAEVGRFNLQIDASRLDHEKLGSVARRRAVGPITKDVERTLGRTKVNTDIEAVRTILRPLLRREPQAHAEPPSASV